MGWVFGVLAFRRPPVGVGGVGAAELEDLAAEEAVIAICAEETAGAAVAETTAEGVGAMAGAVGTASAMVVITGDPEDEELGCGRLQSQKAPALPSPSRTTAVKKATSHDELFSRDRWSVTEEAMDADWLIAEDVTLGAAGGNVSGIMVAMLAIDPVRMGSKPANGSSAAESSLAVLNRRARSFSRQRKITASRPGGRSGRSSLGRRGSVWSTSVQS